MPSDSGYSIEDSTHEAGERLPALNGDTPDPLLGLLPVELLWSLPTLLFRLLHRYQIRLLLCPRLRVKKRKRMPNIPNTN